jgi:RNA polymerase sigma factor (sigma-70 family)
MADADPGSRRDEPETRKLSRAELDALVESHMDRLRDHVRRGVGPLLRARETADDVVQSTVREVYEGSAGVEFTSEPAFRKYLLTLATHKIISKSRRHRALRRTPEREVPLADGVWELPQPGASRPSRSPSAQAELVEDVERLRSAFAELDEEGRRIVAMRKVLGRTTREIATELGLPESTVRFKLARHLAWLASRMA